VIRTVEFLETIGNDDFEYKKGKRYCAIIDASGENLKNIIFVRQPNSPKNENWWTSFPKNNLGTIFKILEREDLSLLEREEEDRLMQL